MSDPIVVCDSLSKEYRTPGAVVRALQAVDVELPRGALAVVHGRSGSGKTTLLNMIGGLDRPTSGRVTVDGAELSTLSTERLVRFRRDQIGFVFQGFGLIGILSAAENVELPLRLRKVEPGKRRRRVRELLELVGLADRASHRPQELSGGEQQRVAIVRALANDPKLLIADEPTGQLDSDNARRIMELIRTLVDERGVSAVVATHDPIFVDLADRVVELRDGRVLSPAIASP
ncbi:MAG: ABC transporter ATP-binding protein [Gaiellaceae bacterium]